MERQLYAYTYIRQPFDEAARLLAEAPATILEPATEVAAEHAREVHTELHVGIGGFEVGRDVTIEIGEFRPEHLRSASLPLRWHATEHEALFPSMDAVLELQALSLRRPLTQVSLIGSYRPPFGLLGAAADAVLGRRLADAAAHRFVMEVAARIEQAMATRDAVPLA